MLQALHDTLHDRPERTLGSLAILLTAALEAIFFCCRVRTNSPDVAANGAREVIMGNRLHRFTKTRTHTDRQYILAVT